MECRIAASASFAVILFSLFLAVSHAQNWSKCSKDCGGGTKTRENCLFVGVCSKVYRPCNTQPCVSGWGQWQSCSKTCGGGIRFKVRKASCTTNDIMTCPKTYDDCNTKACAPVKCGYGRKHRYKDLSSCCKHSKEGCGMQSSLVALISGGSYAKLGHWPWMAGLVNKKEKTLYCGATLIHKRWLISAAHCFNARVDSYALLGSITIKRPSRGHQKVDIEKPIIHNGFKGVIPIHDIALVKLKNDVTFTPNINPICLPKGEIVQPGTTCRVLGWGLTVWHNHSSLSDRLKQVALKVYPLDACIHGYKVNIDDAWKRLNRKQTLCVGKLSGGDDSCQGDSGGPVLCQRCSSCGWFLAGTISGGNAQCGTGTIPSSNMNIYYYEYWIRKHVTFPDRGYYIC